MTGAVPSNLLENIDSKMDRVHLQCEYEHCSNSAKAFGMKETVKIRSCEEHIFSLLNKNFQFFDISGYDFISTLEDASEFGKRKLVIESGLRNLAALEGICEAELIVAFQTLESVQKKVIKSVENRFEEMKIAVTAAGNKVKQELLQLKVNLEEFLTTKENQLSSLSECICSELSVSPRFVIFAIAEESDSISAVLSNSWELSTVDISSLMCTDSTERSAAIHRTLAEAAGYAQKGIPEALQCAELLIGGEISYDRGIFSIISKIMKAEKKRLRNWEWLEDSWELRQQHQVRNEETVRVGQQLATIYYRQFGRLSEAEKVLRECYDISKQLDPLSEGQICNEICGVFVANARYEEAETLSTRILEIFTAADFKAECYWTTLLYLTYSMCLQGKKNEASANLENWQSRNLQPETTLAKMLRLICYGVEAYFTHNLQEAKQHLFQARRIGMNYFPTSPFTALTNYRLSFIAEGTAREQYHRYAQSIYEVAAPKSIEAAHNLYSLGLLYLDTEKLTEAEKCFKQADSIYKVIAPESTNTADNLWSLGNLYLCTEKWIKAEKCCRKAESIYLVVAPKSINFADTCFGLGTMFRRKQFCNKAEGYFRKAQSIYEAAPTSMDATNSLWTLGTVYFDMNILNKAEECFRKVQSIYEVTAPQSIYTADNCFMLGVLMKTRKQLTDAEAWFQQASRIYAVSSPVSIDAGHNLYSLGHLYMDMGRWDVAEKSLKQAQTICEAFEPSVQEAYIFSSMGKLAMRKSNFDDAESCFQRAESIFELVAPTSIHAAVNKMNYGNTLKRRKNWSEAERSFQQAESIFEVAAPKSVHAAVNKANFGVMLNEVNSLSEAKRCFQQAESIFEATAPQSLNAAVNKINYCRLLKQEKKWSEAEEASKEAQSILELTAPQSVVAAHNYFSMGQLLEARNKGAQAIEYYQKAAIIYSKNDSATLQSSAEASIARLKKSAS